MYGIVIRLKSDVRTRLSETLKYPPTSNNPNLISTQIPIISQ